MAKFSDEAQLSFFYFLVVMRSSEIAVSQTVKYCTGIVEEKQEIVWRVLSIPW